MKAVVQRVASAAITLNGETLHSIGKGLFILVGVDRFDSEADIAPVIKKVLNGKLFEDDQGGLWKQNISEAQGEILCASQFTLFARFKGNRPDFHESMEPVKGKELYEAFVEACRTGYNPEKVKAGKFGSTVQIHIVNDGPTTILFDTQQQQAKSTATSTTASGTATPITDEAAEAKKKQAEIRAAKAARKAEHEQKLAANIAKKEQERKEWAERDARRDRERMEKAAAEKVEGAAGKEDELAKKAEGLKVDS